MGFVILTEALSSIGISLTQSSQTMRFQCPKSSFPGGYMQNQTENQELTMSSKPKPKLSPKGEGFQVGEMVCYGLHGKCRIASIESQTVGGQTLPLYRIQFTTDITPNRARKKDSSILIPLDHAEKRGLRHPILKEDVDAIFELMECEDFFFPIDRNWKTMQPKLEKTIRDEGCKGLAKVLGFLFVLKNRQTVPTPELAKLHENVERVLFRELADSLEITVKEVTDKAEKLLQIKLQKNN